MGRAQGKIRRICFVTGTRAEFGLMRTTLEAIEEHRGLKLQIIATGMHLDRKHGTPLKVIDDVGFNVDQAIKWKSASGADPSQTAGGTGLLMAALSKAYSRLGSDIVMVVGDRVEAFAAAATAQISQLPVAHIHGGDRAMGQVDDSLRHAITKLSHIHFPATAESAGRIERLGEDKWRIFQMGSPGVDGIKQSAEKWERISIQFPQLKRRQYALVVLHPVDADERVEKVRAGNILSAMWGRRPRRPSYQCPADASAQSAGIEKVIIIHPNNDPGARGILARWKEAQYDPRVIQRPDISRSLFLGLLRDAACLVGNSSSGIIEAATFGTPVVDIGPRQTGRQHGENVVHCGYQTSAIRAAIERIWNAGRPVRSRPINVYGRDGAGRRIAKVLARIELSHQLIRKVIRY